MKERILIRTDVCKKDTKIDDLSSTTRGISKVIVDVKEKPAESIHKWVKNVIEEGHLNKDENNVVCFFNGDKPEANNFIGFFFPVSGKFCMNEDYKNEVGETVRKSVRPVVKEGNTFLWNDKEYTPNLSGRSSPCDKWHDVSEVTAFSMKK